MKGCLLLLIIASVYGRITVKLPDVHEDNTNVESIKSKTGVYIKIVDDSINTIFKDKPVPTTTEKSSKTCPHTTDIDNNIDTDEQPCVEETEEDSGEALLLTPYIEEGRLQEARAASRVDPKLFLGYESFSGFLTVDKKYQSNMFFWYFPAPKPAPDQPWIIWLQGGPGASSLIGLFDEVGPFKAGAEGGSLKVNPHSWLQNHSIVFIDNPVGTGFSYTEHSDGYVTDMATYSKHLYRATKQFLQIFPELRTAPLYVTGESYAGKYVPALGMEIHRHKDAPGGDINLKGLIIGNALVEPSMISETTRPFINFGLLEMEQIDAVQPLLEEFQVEIAANRSVEAKQKWTTLIILLLSLSHQQHGYNFLRDSLEVGYFMALLRQSHIKRAIHVGDKEFDFVNSTVNSKLAPDFLSNTKPMFEELLEHYRVLGYCGQLDQMLPCAASAESFRTWKWSGSGEFKNATRTPLMQHRRVAGYLKTGGGLTWAVIRGAGHMVPQDTPRTIFQLVSAWTHQLPLPTGRAFTFDFLKNGTVVYL